jgi:hypothetical protein
MHASIFLSYPKPSFQNQQGFVDQVVAYLRGRGLEPRTLGVTDYDTDAPLKAIRRLMMESNGLITIAFRRTLVERAIVRPGTDLSGAVETLMTNQWLTTPWSHIEPAMAYQIGLPILLLRERGVVPDGVLERGVVGLYMPEFDVSGNIDVYLKSAEWNSIINKWEGHVRAVVERKGNPPQLY